MVMMDDLFDLFWLMIVMVWVSVKVNLVFGVGGFVFDGFYLLVIVFEVICIYDEVVVICCDDLCIIFIVLGEDVDQVFIDEMNLVW